MAVILLLTYQWALSCFARGIILAINDLENYDVALLSSLSARSKSALHHLIFFIDWLLICQPSNETLPDPEFSYNTQASIVSPKLYHRHTTITSTGGFTPASALS